MRTVGFLLACGLGLLAVFPAAAKGLIPRRVCGETACVAIDNSHESMVVLYPKAAGLEPAPGPYYRIDYRVAGASPQYYVPNGNSIGAEGGAHQTLRWFAVRDPGIERIRTAIRGLAPFPAPDAWPAVVTTSSGEKEPGRLPGAAIVLLGLASGAILALRRVLFSGTF